MTVFRSPVPAGSGTECAALHRYAPDSVLYWVHQERKDSTMTFVIAASTIVAIFALRIWEDRKYTPAELQQLSESEKKMRVL